MCAGTKKFGAQAQVREQTQLKDTHRHTQNTAVNNCAATKNCCLLQTSFKVNAQIVERRLHARIKIGGIPMAIFKDSFQRMLANDAAHEEHQRAIPQRNHNYCLCFFLCCTALATTCHCMNVAFFNFSDDSLLVLVVVTFKNASA